MASNKIYIPYYISNNTGAPAQVLPRVFFYNGLKDSDPYWIQHWTTSSFGKTIIAEQYSAFPYFDNYSGQVTTTSSLSLLFLNEDPVYGTQTPSQSLYDAYWSKYVDLLYNPRTRIIRLSAVIPFAAYNKLELNDIIQLRSNYYHLRAINDYNLRTGECRMELLGPLLEGSLNNTFTFDNTCEQVPTLYGSVINDTGSRTITFAITGSNCCNNPNYVTVKAEFGTGSCPSAPTNTAYVTLPNSYPIVVDYASLLAGYPTVNCVTMSVANLCYGIPITGSYLTFFTGSLSGSYGNVAISASVQKNNCPVCQTGSFYTTFIAAGTFESTASQADANNQAVAYLTSVSQSNANTYGSCSINYYYNSQISNSIRKNNCTTCQTGSLVTYTLPASQSQYISTCSYAEAQSNAYAYYNSTSQSYANTNGTCTTNYYYNTQLSASVTRNNCLTCQTGSTILYNIPASSSMFTNTCSLSEAQTSASIYFAATSQSYANTNATCSINYKYSTAISASVQKNDCLVCGTGSFSTITLPASYSFDSCSQANAQTVAQNYFNSISQSQANLSGSCTYTTYYSQPISASVQKDDCFYGPYLGTYSLVSIPASQSNSTCSLVDANNKAQTYFNSISQSRANASGSCFNFKSTKVSFTYDMDVRETGSLFPLTASILATTTTASLPSETDPRWVIMGYITGTVAGEAETASYASFNGDTYYSGSYSGSNMIKVRGNNGAKIYVGPFIGYTDSDVCTSWGGQNVCNSYYAQLNPSASTYFVNVGKKIYGNISQSVGNSIENNIKFNIYNGNGAAGIQGFTASIVTASVIYSTSSTYPSFSESGWRILGFMSSSTSFVNGLYLNNVWISGALYQERYNETSWVSQSNYYYFKFQSGSTQLFPGTGSLYTTSSFVSTSLAISGGVIKSSFFPSSGSPLNSAILQIRT